MSRPKLWKSKDINSVGKISIVAVVIITLVFGVWFYAGVPRIWQNPPIPPEIYKV